MAETETADEMRERLLKAGGVVVAEGVMEVPMDSLRPFDFHQTSLGKKEQAAFLCDELWVSGRYAVYVRYEHPTGWTAQDKDGKPVKLCLTHLSIKRHDRESMHDWRDLQMIKTVLCGPEAEAMEVYPAESRLVDTANQYHLWVLPKGMALPFGFADGRLVVTTGGGKAEQRPFEVPPLDAMSQEEVTARAFKYISDAGLDPKDVLG